MPNLSEITIMTETLIGLLDAFDLDPDLEDNADYELTGDDELELGWTEQEARWNRYHGAGADVSEPSLGSLPSMNQAHWSKGGTDDGEKQCDDEGAIDADREPELGA